MASHMTTCLRVNQVQIQHIQQTHNQCHHIQFIKFRFNTFSKLTFNVITFNSSSSDSTHSIHQVQIQHIQFIKFRFNTFRKLTFNRLPSLSIVDVVLVAACGTAQQNFRDVKKSQCKEADCLHPLQQQAQNLRQVSKSKLKSD